MDPFRQATVTIETFASHLTVDDKGLKYGDLVPEMAKLASIKQQRSILRCRSEDEQLQFLSKFAAQYLPRLVNAWKANKGAFNSHACMLNFISSNGVLYFSRFIQHPEARDMTAIQMKRMASDDFPGNYGSDDIGDISQFLSTLLMHQGIVDVDPQHKAVVLSKLEKAKIKYEGQWSGEMSERCHDFLKGDVISIMMHNEMKKQVERGLTHCGAEGCPQSIQDNRESMMQCAKCKVAVYCGREHQKQAWPTHKRICFQSSFQ